MIRHGRVLLAIGLFASAYPFDSLHRRTRLASPSAERLP